MKRIIVAGALANKCGHGGEAWVRLSWVLGFRQLGYDVHFVEQIDREACVGADRRGTDFAGSVNRAWFESVVTEFGLRDSATLIYDNGAEFCGPGEHELREFAAGAELLVNISGHLTYAPVFERVRRRAYVDIDPGFTQFWTAQGSNGARLDGHDVYFTIGENIGAPHCPIPTCGIEWCPTRPPVVLDQWPVADAPRFGRFTTIASWRGPFGPVQSGGVTYGLKCHEFRKFLGLPRRTSLPFEIALNIHPADAMDREALLNQGWELVEPARVAATPRAFREYIQNSSAEFSVAQGIYAQTRSGWFSDRTAHYLASGKPALVQDTGSRLPAGAGLVTFNTLDEAADRAAEIAANFPNHCAAARALAEEFFDSRKVLRRFLDDALHSSQPQPTIAHAN